MTSARFLVAFSALSLVFAASGCTQTDDGIDSFDDEGAIQEAASALSVTDWYSIGSPPVYIDTIHTPREPAIATLNGTQYGVYRIDTDMYWIKRVGNTWTKRVEIPGRFTVDKVSLAPFNGFLYMVRADENDRTAVMMSRFDPATETWSNETSLPYQGFNGPPAIATFENKLFFVGSVKSGTTYPMWVGAMSTSETFTTAKFLGAAHEAASQPSLAAHGTKLFVAHRNGATGGIVYSTHAQGTAATDWTNPLPILAGPFGAGIAGVDPAIASVAGYLHLVHTRPNAHDTWWTYFNGCKWAPEVTIPKAISDDDPALTAGGAGLVMLRRVDVDFNSGENRLRAEEYDAPPAPITPPGGSGCGVVSQ